MNRHSLSAFAALCAIAASCAAPDVSPGLDITCRPEDPTCQPGSIQGSVTYQGTRRGPVILFLFATSALPPPDGTSSQAQALAKISEQDLFGAADASQTGPFSAPFTFSQVPPGEYQIRAFIDHTGGFEPFFDFAQQPRAGDPVGGHVTFDSNGVPHFAALTVHSAERLQQITVAVGQELPFDPPSFTLKEASGSPAQATLTTTMDRPQFLHLTAQNLNVAHATFSAAHFGVELALDANGLPAVSDGDGFFDVYPQVLLKQYDQINGDGTRTPVDAVHAAILPAKVNALPLLPLLFSKPSGGPVSFDDMEIAVLPFPVQFLPTPVGQKQRFQPLEAIPAGAYQVVVIEKSGQVWTLPNSLASSVPSQAAHVEITPGTIPSGTITGTIRYTGSASPGNVTVQAYRVGAGDSPPPNGTELPTRVQIIRGSTIPKTTSGFSAPYTITGLPPGNYVIEALSDGDGNFAPFNLLQTPTRGDLLGGHLDGTGHIAPVTVAATSVPNIDVTLVSAPGQDPQGNGLALDAPAFVVDTSAAPASIAVDARSTKRLTLKAQPVNFPIGAGQSSSTFFTVQLVRDASGNTVDADGDGLPDVWPKIFVVKLDDNDPTGLTQATPTVAIPAAVDPTPFMPALLASNAPVLSKSVSVILRPTAVDATNPAAPRRLPSMPIGRYKIVVMNATGQLWQIPNEAGATALDPRSVALVSGAAQQSAGFAVLPPQGAVPGGAIAGTLSIQLPAGTTTFANAYVFAYDARNPPPPAGTGTPISLDVHTQAEATGSNGAYTVAYTLPALPPANYLVTAIVDTRGDFALDPQLFAAAPGQGAIVGGHLDQNNQLAAVSVAAAPVAGVNAVAVAAGALANGLPARPSFVLVDSTNNPIVSDVSGLFTDALTPARIALHATQVLGASVAAKPEAGPFGFPVSYRGCASNGQPLDSDFDGVPDLYPRVLVVKLADSDPTGQTIDANTTVIPASIDPTPFATPTGLGSCTANNVVFTSDVSVILAPLAVQPNADGTLVQTAIPPGRYGVVVMSSTGQTWSIPNALQPALLDSSVSQAAKAALAPQGVGLRVSGQVPAAQGGAIRGLVRLSSYQANTAGGIVIAAYKANALPPPIGTGKPVAVQVIPKPFVQQAVALGANAVQYQLANLPAGTYSVAAMMDPSSQFSALLSYAATPPRGAQITFAGGAAPSAIAVSSAPVTAADAFLDAVAIQALPFERPMFGGDATAHLSIAGGVSTVVLTAQPAPAGLAYSPGSTAAFHPLLAQDPTASGEFDVAITGNNAGHVALDGRFRVTTQIVFQPLAGNAATCWPIGAVDLVNTQIAAGGTLCAALVTGANGNCSTGAPAAVAGPPAVTTLAVTVPNNVCLDVTQATPTVVLGAPGQGAYSMTAIEFTGQSWTVPNELFEAGGTSGAAQRAALVVGP